MPGDTVRFTSVKPYRIQVSGRTRSFINAFGVSQTAGFTPLPFAIVEFDAESETPLRDARAALQI